MDVIQGKLRNINKKTVNTQYGDKEKAYFEVERLDNGKTEKGYSLFKNNGSAEIFDKMKDGDAYKMTYDLNGEYKNVKVIEPIMEPEKPRGNATVDLKIPAPQTQTRNRGIEVLDAAKTAQEIFKETWGKYPESDSEWKAYISYFMSLR